MKGARLDILPNNLPINGHTFAVSEVLDGPERRRRWTAEEKARIVAESLEPGEVASAIARRHGVHRNQLYAWRREFRAGDRSIGVAFAPVITEPAPPVSGHGIELAYAGAVIRVGCGADMGLLGQVLQTLKRLG